MRSHVHSTKRNTITMAIFCPLYLTATKVGVCKLPCLVVCIAPHHCGVHACAVTSVLLIAVWNIRCNKNHCLCVPCSPRICLYKSPCLPYISVTYNFHYDVWPFFCSNETTMKLKCFLVFIVGGYLIQGKPRYGVKLRELYVPLVSEIIYCLHSWHQSNWRI